MADEYRSFSGEIRNLQKKNEFLFDVTLRLVNNSVTKNNWQFLDMEGHKNTFAGKPLLIAYEYGKIGGGHNATKKVGKDGKEYLFSRDIKDFKLFPTKEELLNSL